MAEADCDDVIFELHLAAGEVDRNAALARLRPRLPGPARGRPRPLV